ncbi:MAG TPA: hypothetical protein ENK65_00415 [Helicobacteraceae bacterium]|nr:hypothetical protein [Helicobacteraceae bacterium]
MIQWFKNTLSIPVFILGLGIASLTFSAYQAQVSERNETTRRAAFEMLQTLNHLQQLIDQEHYTKTDKSQFIQGWADVLLINDLALFTNPSIQHQSHNLLELWKKSFNHLDDKTTNVTLSKNIKMVRQALKNAILSL